MLELLERQEFRMPCGSRRQIPRRPAAMEKLFALGTLSINLGRIDQAREYLQSYLDKAPPDAPYRATASELVSKLQPAKPPSP